LLNPQSIAVFGLSRSNPFHPANVIFTKNRLRYQARTYGINPKGGKLHGETLYTSIREIPEKVDVAIIAVRAESVPEALRQCVAAGISGAIVVSGGFAEAGRPELRDEIIAICKDNWFPIIGPNCLGAYSPPSFNSFFLPSERLLRPKEGPLGLISQSGGVVIELILDLVQENVGVSRAISMGNKDVVDEVDLFDFYQSDPRTQVIGLYLEGFNDGRGREFAQRVARSRKPVVVLKGGKTPAGSRAAASHTAALSGDYAVFSQIMKQCGAIEARNTREFVSYCAALSSQPACPRRNVAIVSLSGGHGIMASDACHEAGLELVAVPPGDQALLKERLSPNVRGIVSAANPIDLTGSANDNDVFLATEFCLQRDYIDVVVLLLLPYVPAITPDVGAHVSLLRKEFGKPVLVFIPRMDKYKIYIEGFELNGFPVSHSVDSVMQQARALAGIRAQVSS
jgi:acetyltransferase